MDGEVGILRSSVMVGPTARKTSWVVLAARGHHSAGLREFVARGSSEKRKTAYWGEILIEVLQLSL